MVIDTIQTSLENVAPAGSSQTLIAFGCTNESAEALDAIKAQETFEEAP